MGKRRTLLLLFLCIWSLHLSLQNSFCIIWSNVNGGSNCLTTGSDVPAEPIDKYKAIEIFHPYKDGTDMWEFIQALEIEFDQARVNPREYKRILISKLSPKTKDICIDLITDSRVYPVDC